MDYSNIRLMSLMQVKMAYLAENQDVLSQNIANSDTPGFAPKQLKKLDFKRLALIEARRLKMRATSAEHLTGTKPVKDFREEEQRKTYETTPVDNAVALEEQMARMADNKAQYDMTINLYRKTAQLFKTAIGNS